MAEELNIPTVDYMPTNLTNLFDTSSLFGEVDMGGIASIAGVVGGIMAQNDDKKYKKEMLKMEKSRIDRERKRQDAFEADMKSAWGVQV